MLTWLHYGQGLNVSNAQVIHASFSSFRLLYSLSPTQDI
jgi:hypothetical protein